MIFLFLWFTLLLSFKFVLLSSVSNVLTAVATTYIRKEIEQCVAGAGACMHAIWRHQEDFWNSSYLICNWKIHYIWSAKCRIDEGFFSSANLFANRCEVWLSQRPKSIFVGDVIRICAFFISPIRVTRLDEFSPIGSLFTLGSLMKITEITQIFGLLFQSKICA
jgi:hypothetical protein